MKSERPGNRRVKVIAHRGASAEAPENTMPAIRRAVELGVDAVEIDVQFTLDGRPVVIHDASLRRTTGSPGRVNETNFAQLRRLEAGNWFGRDFQGAKIPAFEDVVSYLASTSVGLIVEIKAGPVPENGTRALVAEVEKRGRLSKTIFKSFDLKISRDIHSVHSDVRVVHLTKENREILKTALDSGFEGISIPYRLATAPLVEQAHSKNLTVMVWTVDKPGAIKRMLQLKVDAIISNVPAQVLSLISNSSSNLRSRPNRKKP